MTLEECERVVSRIKLGWPLSVFDFKLEVRSPTSCVFYGPESFELICSAKTPHRDSGVVGPLVSRSIFNSRAFANEEQFVRWLHLVIQRCWQHEVDEAFLYEGRRVFDPHLPEPAAI